MAAPRTNRREQLREGVASVVREWILAGRLRPGDPLRLNKIADELEMSATPVREALLMLEQDGWVLHEPNRGFRVRPVNRSDVHDTYVMWAIAEGEVAARAATRSTAVVIAGLRRIDARIGALERATPGEALELNAQFHTAVHDLSEAPKLVWFTQAARRLVPLDIAGSFEIVPGWLDVNRTQHGPIIDALEAQDVEASRELMRSHFDTTRELLLAHLDDLAFWADSRPPESSASA